MSTQRLNGRTAFLKLLQDEGVTHVFGNPGTTELALMEAMSDAASIKYVLGLQESVVLSMADGFARASGRRQASADCARASSHFAAADPRNYLGGSASAGAPDAGEGGGSGAGGGDGATTGFGASVPGNFVRG